MAAAEQAWAAFAAHPATADAARRMLAGMAASPGMAGTALGSTGWNAYSFNLDYRTGAGVACPGGNSTPCEMVEDGAATLVIHVVAQVQASTWTARTRRGRTARCWCSRRARPSRAASTCCRSAAPPWTCAKVLAAFFAIAQAACFHLKHYRCRAAAIQ